MGKNGSFRIEMIERASEIIKTLNFGECESSAERSHHPILVVLPFMKAA